MGFIPLLISPLKTSIIFISSSLYTTPQQVLPLSHRPNDNAIITQGPKVVSPKKACSCRLRTVSFRAMIEFYKVFLEASVAFANDRAAFLA